uniref:Uncharacterized protein n=1 Tax=Leersia perrieri TaxID=77586 RepID=A0A0D9W3M7_9ORYZ
MDLFMVPSSLAPWRRQRWRRERGPGSSGRPPFLLPPSFSLHSTREFICPLSPPSPLLLKSTRIEAVFRGISSGNRRARWRPPGCRCKGAGCGAP